MAEDSGVRVRDCTEEAFGLRHPVKLEAAVDAGHDEVEPIEHLVRIVEGAVGQNVRLDALQDPEVLAELFVQAIRFVVLLLDLLDPPSRNSGSMKGRPRAR
jgi:hypothetical protein